LAYADDVNIVGENVATKQKNTKALLNASEKVGQEVNPERVYVNVKLSESRKKS
jgi:hypothetical protein